MAPHNVLILGGHGRIAQILTQNLIRRSWNVTSVIRTAEQIPEIESLAKGHPGILNVLVRSLEDIRSDAEASAVLDEANPDMVVWSAGAGGKGAPERTFLVDRDAACHFIRASAARPSVSKFLMVSYIGSRRAKPTWWDDEQWKAAMEVNDGVLANYYKAKIAADEELFLAARKRGDGFAGIGLRPGMLTEEPRGGVLLGWTPVSRGKSSRASVAATAEALLAADGVKTSWIDMLDGEEDVEAAVKKVVETGVDAIEGEPIVEKAE